MLTAATVAKGSVLYTFQLNADEVKGALREV